jgi:Protein of unknown function (DUF4239)
MLLSFEDGAVFYWIYDISTETLAVLMTIVFVGFSWLGAIVVRPILRIFVRSAAGTNDVVGYILSCFCVFYGLLLGLIAVAAYQNYSQVDSAVQSEAALLEALYEDVSTYPEPYGQNLRWLLRDYCRYEIKYAWPQYRNGIVPEGGDTRISAFKERLASFQPQTKDDEITHAEAIRQFNTFLQHRRLREYAVTTGIPAVMWYVVIVGAIINIALVWLFEMKLVTHLFLGGLLSFFLGAVILLIAVMDNPFRGEVSISPDAFESVYRATMMEN